MTFAADPTRPPVGADNLRVGVIGLGFAGTTHLDAYTALPGATVVALAGKEESRLTELADTRCVPNRYLDWEDLVARDDLDIVSIGVPNNLHHPIAISALNRGMHVFCEKPLSTTADLAREMVETARRNDRVLEVAYNHRRRADVRFLSEYVAAGSLGTIYHSRASWLRRTGIPGLGSWFTSKALAGGGPMIDLGSHVLDIALYLLGEPRVVSASAVSYGELGRAGRGGGEFGVYGGVSDQPFEVEDFASALLRLDNGSSLQLEASWASYSKAFEDIEVELLGSTGGVRLHVDDYATAGTLTMFSDIQGVPAVTRPEVTVPAGHHQTVIADFLATVRAGRDAGPAPHYSAHYGEYALHRSEVIDAIYQSAALKREVTI
jgi:predicted dehydrogenase